jgi:DNA transposition AAA+ family ATPase
MHLAETLRAIHDQSGAPLVLVGMSQLPRAIKAVPQLKSRVADWIEFLPCDLRDARTMAEALCEIEVADDLVREIHQKCGGSARKIRTALERVERLARLRTKRRIALGDLPDGFSLTYDFDARGKVPAPSGSEEKSNVVSLRAENA